MAKTQIRIGGLGGQGVIMSGMIIGRACAAYDGRHATLIQSFGPEARGSACSAQVSLSDEPIGYPYVKNPDVLMVFSKDAYLKFIPTLKTDGTLLYESDLVEPQGLPDTTKTFGIPAARFAEELGRALVMNIVMVGFFTGVTGLISERSAEKAVLASVPRGTEQLNLKAFKKGLDYAKELLEQHGR